jgi:hypothetical protein
MSAGENNPMMRDLQELLRSSDSFAALEHIQRHGTPLDIAARYESLVLDLHWKAHDLSAVIIVGRAGIIFCLGQSIAAHVSPEMATQLRSTAKSLAYNVGSFTWPGWEEPGINPTPDDIAVGRDCTRLNLRLAIELNKPPKALSKAYWLIGAHALVSRDFEFAEKQFKLAQSALPPTDPAAKEFEPCNAGFLAVARLCQNPADKDAQASFEAITSQLRLQKDDEAEMYLAQLLSAKRLFIPYGSV